MIQPALLEGRDRYERVMEGWVDNTHEDALTHTVRLSDDDRALDLSVEALPSPSYLIRAARCRPVSGAFDPEVPCNHPSTSLKASGSTRKPEPLSNDAIRFP